MLIAAHRGCYVPADGYYPVVVTQDRVGLDKICKAAEKSTTLHVADVKAVLSFLARYVTERLLCGDRVDLPEIGSLELRIGSDTPITDSADTQIARNLKVRGVWNVEEFDPDPFMEELIKQGLPWHEIFGGDLEL